MWQFFAVIIVLAVAIVYAGYRIYRALTDENEACKGCALAKNCKKKRKNRENIWQCRK
jgi:hypothetical protein